jgi:hypothetical protein
MSEYYTIRLSEEQRRQVAAVLVVEAAFKDGHCVIGEGTEPMLVPPFEAPGSRWFDPGPEYPKEYARCDQLVSRDVLVSLEEWVKSLLGQGASWLLDYLPHEVRVEWRGKNKQALVVERDGEPVSEEEYAQMKAAVEPRGTARG